MTRSSFSAVKPLLLSLCLLSIGAPVANAQIACPQPLARAVPAAPPAPAVPPIDQNHIFCGDVGPGGNAGGFHSRPGGVNPATIGILPGTNITIPPGAAAGVYNLNNFNITDAVNGMTANKAVSTMFPNTCSQANVVAAIRHAFLNGGNSGPTCGAGGPGGAPFNILVVVNAGVIRTAYPQ